MFPIKGNFHGPGREFRVDLLARSLLPSLKIMKAEKMKETRTGRDGIGISIGINGDSKRSMKKLPRIYRILVIDGIFKIHESTIYIYNISFELRNEEM